MMPIMTTMLTKTKTKMQTTDFFAPVVENGVTVMKARFQKRDGNRNRRPPRSPRTMIHCDKFPNEDL